MSSITSLIPKTTTPLTKFIRTTEFWLVVIFNAAMLIIPILTNALPATQAVKYAAIVNTATVIARSGLKAIASIGTSTGLTPLAPADVPLQLAGIPTTDTADSTLAAPPETSVKPDPGTPVQDAPSAPSGTTTRRR